MRSILSMIWQYKGVNLVFILFIGISMFIMNFLHKNLTNRRNKYFFSLTNLIIAFIFLFFGFRILLTQAGVWLLLYSAILFCTSVITLFYGLYLEIREKNQDPEDDKGDKEDRKGFYAYKDSINRPGAKKKRQVRSKRAREI